MEVAIAAFGLLAFVAWVGGEIHNWTLKRRWERARAANQPTPNKESD